MPSELYQIQLLQAPVQLNLPEPEVVELLVTGTVTRSIGLWLTDKRQHAPTGFSGEAPSPTTPVFGREAGDANSIASGCGIVLGPRYHAAALRAGQHSSQTLLTWPTSLHSLAPSAVARLIASRCAQDASSLRLATLSLLALRQSSSGWMPQSPAIQGRESRPSSSSSPNVLKGSQHRGTLRAASPSSVPGSPGLRPLHVSSTLLSHSVAVAAANEDVRIDMLSLEAGVASRTVDGAGDASEDDEDEEDEEDEGSEEDNDAGQHESTGPRRPGRRSVGEFSLGRSTVGGRSAKHTMATPGGGTGVSRASGDMMRTTTRGGSGAVASTAVPMNRSPAGTASGNAMAPTRSVELTTLQHVPGTRVVRYLGCLNLSFIRESLAVRQGGGLSSFTERLVSEANAVMRGHAHALGANAVLNYRIVPRESEGKVARNQAYHLLTVSGDCVELSGLNSGNSEY